MLLEAKGVVKLEISVMRFAPPLDVSRFSGFIFDCDGTLTDTMVLHFRAWRRALAEGGAHFDFTWEVFLGRAGMSMEATVSELAREFRQELDAAVIAASQRRHFFAMEGEIVAINEVVDFARSLRAQGLPLSVASGSSRASVERSLRRIGAAALFDVVVTPEDVPHGKPDPALFLLAAHRMDVLPGQCLVIEDGALGIEAAKRAGMQCVVVQAAGPPPDL